MTCLSQDFTDTRQRTQNRDTDCTYIASGQPIHNTSSRAFSSRSASLLSAATAASLATRSPKNFGVCKVSMLTAIGNAQMSVRGVVQSPTVTRARQTKVRASARVKSLSGTGAQKCTSHAHGPSVRGTGGPTKTGSGSAAIPCAGESAVRTRSRVRRSPANVVRNSGSEARSVDGWSAKERVAALRGSEREKNSIWMFWMQ